MKCPNCGKGVPDYANVCGYCGHVFYKKTHQIVDAANVSLREKGIPP